MLIRYYVYLGDQLFYTASYILVFMLQETYLWCKYFQFLVQSIFSFQYFWHFMLDLFITLEVERFLWYTASALFAMIMEQLRQTSLQTQQTSLDFIFCRVGLLCFNSITYQIRGLCGWLFLIKCCYFLYLLVLLTSPFSVASRLTWILFYLCKVIFMQPEPLTLLFGSLVFKAKLVLVNVDFQNV